MLLGRPYHNDPGVNHGTFGIEKRAGGQVFQFNFSNGLGNTMSQPHPDVVYLWDEVVGHYVWYAGLALLVAALALAVADRRPRGGLLAYLLAVLVGVTNTTNSIEGQTPWLGIATAAVFALWGLFTRDGMGRYLLTSYGVSLALLVAFGVWQGGFPEFSELGWI